MMQAGNRYSLMSIHVELLVAYRAVEFNVNPSIAWDTAIRILVQGGIHKQLQSKLQLVGIVFWLFFAENWSVFTIQY